MRDSLSFIYLKKKRVVSRDLVSKRYLDSGLSYVCNFSKARWISKRYLDSGLSYVCNFSRARWISIQESRFQRIQRPSFVHRESGTCSGADAALYDVYTYFRTCLIHVVPECNFLSRISFRLSEATRESLVKDLLDYLVHVAWYEQPPMTSFISIVRRCVLAWCRRTFQEDRVLQGNIAVRRRGCLFLRMNQHRLAIRLLLFPDTIPGKIVI